MVVVENEVVILTDCICRKDRYNKKDWETFMNIITRIRKKISKIKQRFDVQKVPIMLQREMEAREYLSRI